MFWFSMKTVKTKHIPIHHIYFVLSKRPWTFGDLKLSYHEVMKMLLRELSCLKFELTAKREQKSCLSQLNYMKRISLIAKCPWSRWNKLAGPCERHEPWVLDSSEKDSSWDATALISPWRTVTSTDILYGVAVLKCIRWVVTFCALHCI